MSSLGKSTITLATTGIAADLLENGRTVHSGFKLPVPLHETSVSRIALGSDEAVRIKNASLILIDEVSMLSKYGLGCIDEVLKRICGNTRLFGGKTVLLGGDFRQTANVVPRGTRNDVIEHSIKSSELWSKFVIYKLIQNMRSRTNLEFANWLLKIGEGTINDIDDQVDIPEQNIENNNIIDAIFGVGNINLDVNSAAGKVILVSKNEHGTDINNRIISRIEGVEREYKSVDTIMSDDHADFINYPQEFLHSQQPSGMPPHSLKLKLGAVIMLIRNLDPASGLLNGTRLIVREMKNTFIVAEIIQEIKRELWCL